jgi:NTP pyrophosphatase (non-canonical NTP hydrolase)
MFHFGDVTWPGLAKLAEESGEVVQVIAKLIAVNGDPAAHWEGSDLRERLIEEIGDLQAAISFVGGEMTHAERAQITERARDKLNLFRRWHYEQRMSADPVTS